MKNLRILFLFIFLAINGIVISQEFQIKNVNENEYPLIKVTVEPTNLKNIDFSKLFIIENSDSTSYSIDSVQSAKNEKAICFLIDQDLTIENNRNNIVDIIKDIAVKLGEGDYINVVLTAEKKAKGSCIYPLSYEFSDKPQSFIEFLDTYFTSASFSVKPKNMNCSIEQSLDFINAKTNLPAIKYLIIISKIPYAGGQDWENLRKKADEAGILFQWFSYTSNVEFSKTYNTKIQDIIKARLDSLDSNPNMLKKLNKKSYLISFFTNQNEKLNQFEIDYKGVKIRSTFERLSYFSFFKENALFFGIIAVSFVLVLSFIAILLYTKRQMSLSIKELRKSNENHIINTGSNFNEDFDSLKTLHGSTNLIPKLSIEIDGVRGVFELKKIINNIGRHHDNDLIIDNLTISSHHATLTKEGGSFYIQDNESTNGTFINDLKISKSIVKSGDLIRIGKASLILKDK